RQHPGSPDRAGAARRRARAGDRGALAVVPVDGAARACDRRAPAARLRNHESGAKGKRGSSMRKIVFAAGAFGAALAGAACAGKGGAPPKETVPVVAATVESRTVPLEVQAIGHVDPLSTVAVKTRIGGEITEVGFREGQDVKPGDLLFVIDPRPYE